MTDEQLLVDTSDLVHIDNTETINGLKYFSRDTVVKNLSPMMTNCITEIPQNVKLELNNGTLTLKAGSKVYIPNGFEADGTTPKFDVIITTNDLTYSYTGTGTGEFISYLVNGSSIGFRWTSNQTGSGTSTPTSGNSLYYNINENKCYHISNGVPTLASFPFCIGTVNTSNTIISIDQVFNGFGYIGSTVFALPGVKGLIPNGRNADGSLKNIEFTTSNVVTKDSNSSDNKGFVVNNQGKIFIRNGIYETETQPSTDYSFWYKPSENVAYDTTNGTLIRAYQTVVCYFVSDSNHKITSFTPKTAFHALDYNDSSTISGWSMPSSRYIDLTLGASGSTYTAPANGWFHIAKIPGSSGTQVTMVNTCVSGTTDQAGNFTIRAQASTNGMTIYLNLLAKKGDVVVVNYTASGSTDAFRFIYAEGDQ